mmetsp:Transcript_12696/g.19158  ORF Transcript_12696/g.19158 Transcript_12696/m.19158 type:complete len:437 (-) Transcript_12696:115-1425(-)|eukprot:scaffold8514_cov74-Skeletonema_dohrnii-CCMP3373.AAC.7
MSAKSTRAFHRNGNSNEPTLIGLPHDILHTIAGFLHPPDVHSLNDAFSPDGFTNQSTHLPDSNVTEFRDGFLSASTSTLANALLYKSQLEGLTDVLHSGPAQFSYEDIKALFTLQKNLRESDLLPILLSGSTMVQTMTGLRFSDSDLDFYVDSFGAHALRDFLRSLGFVCHRVSSSYHGFHFQDSQEIIHHVESYILPSPATVTTTALTLRRRWRFKSVPTLSRLNSIKNRTRGRNLDWLHGDYFIPHDFPFTNNADDCVKKICDIVVTRDGFTPQHAIDQFDLNICKCTWDGTKMTNPNGNKTYLKTTAWHEDWGTLVNGYMQKYIHHLNCTSRIHPSPRNPPTVLNLVFIMNSLSSVVIDNNAKIPCIEHGFTCNCLNQAFDNNYYRSLNRTILRRFKRMVKYTARGICMPLESDLLAAFADQCSRVAKRPRNA